MNSPQTCIQSSSCTTREAGAVDGVAGSPGALNHEALGGDDWHSYARVYLEYLLASPHLKMLHPFSLIFFTSVSPPFFSPPHPPLFLSLFPFCLFLGCSVRAQNYNSMFLLTAHTSGWDGSFLVLSCPISSLVPHTCPLDNRFKIVKCVLGLTITMKTLGYETCEIWGVSEHGIIGALFDAGTWNLMQPIIPGVLRASL